MELEQVWLLKIIGAYDLVQREREREKRKSERLRERKRERERERKSDFYK